jgi:hypothetical protein
MIQHSGTNLRVRSDVNHPTQQGEHMRAIAVNGSPRKNWNTASLLEHALTGAAKNGAETELVHLYDLDFKGCISCFACKKIGGKSYGRCAVSDGVTPILKKASWELPCTSVLKLGR